MATLQNTIIENLTISEVMSIDGNLIRPNLPVACVSKNDGGACFGTLGPVPFNIVHLVSGITMSNGNSRFTVPEDGQYFCLFWTIGHNDCGTTGRLYIRVNGSLTSAQARTDGSIRYGNCYAFRIYDLKAGDYVEADLTAASLYFNSEVYNKFIIYKVI